MGRRSRELFTVSIPGTLGQTLRALELIGFDKAERHLPLGVRSFRRWCSRMERWLAESLSPGGIGCCFESHVTGRRSRCLWFRPVHLAALSRSGIQPAPPRNPGSGGGTSSGTGQLTVGITDSPFSDALAVLITFSEVSVHRSGGGWESIAFAGGALSRTCDLKELQGPADILGVSSLPAGHYTQIRLTVRSATIYFANASVSVTPCATAIAGAR